MSMAVRPPLDVTLTSAERSVSILYRSISSALIEKREGGDFYEEETVLGPSDCGFWDSRC
jgi:hypothetical protein